MKGYLKMNKKLALLSCFLLKTSVIHSMQSIQANEFPTEQQAMATRNPLTICLYFLHKNYTNMPVIPQDMTFEARLSNHILLKDRWIVQKGFLEDLQKLHEAGSSLEDVRVAIEKNTVYNNFANFNMQVTQKILMSNLLQAYKDCSGLSNSKP